MCMSTLVTDPWARVAAIAAGIAPGLTHEVFSMYPRLSICAAGMAVPGRCRAAGPPSYAMIRPRLALRSTTMPASGGASVNVHAADREELFDLVEAARSGDRAAFGQVYDLLAPKVYRFAMARLSSAPDAEDVVAETFIAAWKRLDSFQWMGAPFASWLMAFAHRRVLQCIGDRQRHAVVELDVERDAGMGESHDRAVEMGIDLAKHLEQLPEEHRQVLMLRFFGGLSAEEVGQVVGKNANAVRQLQMKALERLQINMRREEAA